MSNIISTVSLKQPGKLSATYNPARAPHMGRYPRPTREMIEAVRRETHIACPVCNGKMQLLTTHQNKRDELYCAACHESVPLYE